ncbi:uncharacterized protein OCT59_019215 [Rhizophagus irregularis]|uniref:Centrosomal protein CEP104 Zn finger domain-containing protein n=1 Tax=Rhizophagus irregularis TaxID=588596 RepID=A0A915ZMV9_9GLOM|nr:hypothetical protein OCT59_019215 [Rhizophagus irregularis]GBC33856.2 hypothetical protein GLOIN_2v1688833 [Rhizophagus irregularis DAOM 181602=DAOM 197198]CAB4485977.1 unnamed protein product [Rhizophagus irregularis]CAB5383811.1 unnamed protein product [Rhizophagus irregularis]
MISKFVKQCPCCREVMEVDEYLEHMAKQSCIAIQNDAIHCPLCKIIVEPTIEQGWKSNRRNSRLLIAFGSYLEPQ